MVTLEYQNQVVVIDGGELVSYQVGAYEFMHQKGDPGWGHTDTEMFPVIGPTEKAGYRVQVPKGNAIQDQHGLLRELDYILKEEKGQSATYWKEYKSGTIVVNSKYPERSKARNLLWPFNFRFEKRFHVDENGLKITFTISGDRDMPYMLGYHPAFALRSPDARVVVDGRSIGVKEVMAAGDRALEVGGAESLILQDERSIEIRSGGFGQFMLWSPAPNMICVEPVTFYPYSLPQVSLHEGFMYLDRPEVEFEVFLIPKLRDEGKK